MKRLDYEAPTMEEIVVEMEQGFLAASGEKIIQEKNTKVSIERQEGFDKGDIEIEGWE